MCESSVFMKADGKETLVMEAVDIIKSGDGEVVLQSILGDTKTLRARISELRLVEHKIILEPAGC